MMSDNTKSKYEKVMLFLEAFGVILAALFVMVGWFITNHQNVKQEQRSFRADHLVESFHKLYCISNTGRNMNTEENKQLNEVMAAVNLFGTPKQITLARDFANQMKNHGGAQFTEFLTGLRDELRKELTLESLENEIILFRAGPSKLGMNETACQLP